MAYTENPPAVRDLIERILRRDKNAWSELDCLIRPDLENALQKRLGRGVNTQELASHVLVVLWQKDMKALRAFDLARPLLPYLVTIGIRWHQKALQRELPRRQIPLGSAHSAANRIVDERTIVAAAEEFCSTLPEPWQERFQNRILKAIRDRTTTHVHWHVHPPQNGRNEALRTFQRWVQRQVLCWIVYRAEATVTS
jgi:hypothetical protein